VNASLEADPGRGITVLLVEDDPDMRWAVRDVLLMRGFVVNTAEDGLQAVECASRRNYDVLVCDVRLPGLDGLSVARIVRRLTPQTRVLLMTAFPEWKVSDAAAEAGVVAVLSKPLNLAVLTAAVVRAAGRSEVEA
jgi:DNA-binding response OmpR family regulator